MPTNTESKSVGTTETTGHEWDGITELDTPLPRLWLHIMYASIAVSIVYFVLYPGIPWLSGHTKGLLGHTERAALEETMAAARAEKAVYLERIDAMTPGDVRKDPELLNFAMAGGKSAFADNCAPCHGAGGAGRPGFPSLADDAWLWGGTLEAIHTTLRYGVRWAANEQTRVSEMPRFGGADGVFTSAQIADVTQYVLSLSGRSRDPASAKGGAPLYAENCASCHGPNGEGNPEVGAPKLSDAVWLYGDTAALIARQIGASRHGVMPAWEGRLDPATLKMLAVYVHALGGGT
jgi:cytochrome c oxidase cbb3-type subunit 3